MTYKPYCRQAPALPQPVAGYWAMVIAHVEMVAIVVFGNARLPVVRRVDVELAIEHMGGRVGHVVTRENVS